MTTDDRHFLPSLSFPRMHARSLRFTLGAPRDLTVSPDGGRVLFIRTADGTARAGALWSYDPDSGAETCLADAATLLGDAGEELSTEERARRERSRESAAGIVGYATDRDVSVAVFALSGRLWVCDVGTGESRTLPSHGPVIDPRTDPTGRHVAYASGGGLRVVGTDGTLEHLLAGPEDDETGDVVWGQAEFVAAEEMSRHRGYWWAPDGTSLLVERYDDRPVAVWHVADPANPDAEPVRHRYPAAGTDDADVSLWHVALDGSRTQIRWDRTAFPYLTRVSWTLDDTPLIQVMSRDQKRAEILAIDLATGETTSLRAQSDEIWVDLVPGVPAYAPDGRLVTCEDAGDTKRVFLDGAPLSPDGVQVRAVLDVAEDGVLASATAEPTESHVLLIGYDGSVSELTSGRAVHSAVRSGGTTVVSRSGLDAAATSVTVWRSGELRGTIGTRQADPGFVPQVRLLNAGERALRTAVLFPRGHEPGSARLPVVLSPYGGPHAQRVICSARAYLEPQWLADQGFCVVVADGRGTPARGHAWERAVRDDLARVTLQDQVDALDAVAKEYPDDVDTDRVGITGWSYGGYLAALAVLQRPDVFAAAVAGAPVTEWRLYDTFYTERYLGHPDEQPAVYDANSPVRLAASKTPARPLMIIHGMVDDNVVVAHSLRLSAALLAAGRPHTVLPLTGVTHMASDEVVAENLALLRVDFLRRALTSNASTAP